MAKNIRLIPRGRTADERQKADKERDALVKQGWEVYETNARHYKLRDFTARAENKPGTDRPAK